MEGLLLLLLLGALYFLPTIVAANRKHHSAGGIFALNLLLGWTFLGWALGLVWAFSYVIPRSASPPVTETPRPVTETLRPPVANPVSSPRSPMDGHAVALAIVGFVIVGGLCGAAVVIRSQAPAAPAASSPAPASALAPTPPKARSGWETTTTSTTPEVIAAFIAPVGTSNPSPPKAGRAVQDIGVGQTTATQRRAYIVESQARVKAKMPDPGSVTFKDTFFSGTAGMPLTCGWANGKTKAGRQMGFRKFVATGGHQGMVIIDDDSNRYWILGQELPTTGRPDIENSWRRFCVGA